MSEAKINQLENELLKNKLEISELRNLVDKIQTDLGSVRINVTSLKTNIEAKEASAASTSKGKSTKTQTNAKKNPYQWFLAQSKDNSNIEIMAKTFVESGALKDSNKSKFEDILKGEGKILEKVRKAWELVEESHKKDGGSIKKLIDDMYNKTNNNGTLLKDYLGTSSLKTSPIKDLSKDKKKVDKKKKKKQDTTSSSDSDNDNNSGDDSDFD